MNTRIDRTRIAAFTLIELLTVIAIIAILMALLFPAIGAVRDTAKKTEAKTAEMNIVAAVKAFNTEYGKYPSVSTTAPATTGDTLVGDVKAYGTATADNNGLFDVLRNISDTGANQTYAGNPRRIVFFEGKSCSNPASPKSGFLDNPATGGTGTALKGAFYDPWGTEYFIMIDTDYDNQIADIGKTYTDFATNPPQTGVGVFSFGKDRLLGSPNATPAVTGMYKSGTNTSDDVVSWQ